MLKVSSLASTLLVLLILLASCIAPASPITPAPAASDPTQPAALTPVTIGLGYIPSVQFAPFYVAREKGFFAEQGLDITYQHGNETDFLQLIGVNKMQFAVAGGDQVILGRAQELPLTYVAAWYHQFPVVVMSLKDKGLDSVAKLQGQRVGIPGLYGASLVAWKALTAVGGLDESKVTLETIGFTQAAAVSEGRVDAALDYATNGPVQLRLAGQEVNVIPVSDLINLPGNGLVTNEQTVTGNADLVQRVTNALLAGIRYTLDNPDEAFTISLQAVPEAGGDNEAANRAIFDASLPLWQADAAALGRSDIGAWQQAADFMLKTGLINSAVKVDGIVTNQFVEAAP
ncbi:MAG: ABC transporter substrate-binding protein [Anaerolineae bacterium]